MLEFPGRCADIGAGLYSDWNMSTEETPRYYEDFEIGETFEFDTHTLTQEEIVEFAKQYDPQPFHIDEQLAQNSVFGGLIASGWHTAAVCTGCSSMALSRTQRVQGAVVSTNSAGTNRSDPKTCCPSKRNSSKSTRPRRYPKWERYTPKSPE